VIAGVIDARRGDTFGFTAFTSYGVFWIGLASAFMFQWQGLVTLDNEGLGWLMICWAVFTGYMSIGTFKITKTHTFVFLSLTVLFILLALHFLVGMSAVIAGVEGLFCGAAAVYGSMAVVTNDKYGRTVFPLGQYKK
jgi:succinate-acetate transporter protein